MSDRIALVACVSAFLQFIALVVTIGIMIRSSHRQLRAHLFPDTFDIVDGMMLNPPEPHKTDMPGVIMTIKNSGQTPAYEVVSWWNIMVISDVEENTLTLPKLAQKFYTAVGAGCSFNKTGWFYRSLTEGERTEIFRGTLGIYVFGRIEYKDAFKKQRFTNFRMVYTSKVFPPPKGAVMGIAESGNNAD